MSAMNAVGYLIYLVGSSGAGKDTVLNAMRADMAAEQGGKVRVMNRYITRPSHVGNEDHISMTESEFIDHRQRGLFALNWEAHNTMYAIGAEVDECLAQGLTVVINGSRAYFPEAIKRYPMMKMVWITVDSQVLKQRLLNRGRDNAFEVQQRVIRNEELDSARPDDCVTIDNSGDINATLVQFSEVLNTFSASEYV